MTPAFTLTSNVFSNDSLVVEFTGYEHISNLFKYDVLVADTNPDIEFEAAFGVAVTLKITTQGIDNYVHGYISEMEMTNEIMGDAVKSYVYRIAIVPDLWYWSLNVQNKVYQNLSLPEIAGEVFSSFAPVQGMNFSFENTTGNDPKEFVIQYKESDLGFVSRLAEHEGVFYFFNHTKAASQIRFGDDNQYFVRTGVEGYNYTRDAGPTKNDTHIIFNFTGARRESYGKSQLLDYNYLQPDAELTSEMETTTPGVGTYHEFSPNYQDTGVGGHLSTARAVSFDTGKYIYKGHSNSGTLRAGSLFTLTNHYRASYNTEYLITGVIHRGDQRDAAAGGAMYKNEFTAIPSSVTYRPSLSTPKPKLYGVMTGKIVGSQMHGRAELDDIGRYKVRLPFDISGSTDENASCYIRMAQAYGGNPSDTNKPTGMHMPLLPGTEVIWSCIDGDLDRPVINGIVPNPNTQSPVKTDNYQNNILRTTSGITMTFNDGLVGKPDQAPEPIPALAQKVPTYTGDQGAAFSVDVPDQWSQKSGLRLGGTEENTDLESPLRADQQPYYAVNAGWYDYTDGDHVSYTKGKRTDMVEGGNYDFILTDGATQEDGSRNIIKQVHYDQSEGGWKKIELNGPDALSYQGGWSESFFVGYKFSADFALTNSINVGGNVSISAAFDLSFAYGTQLSLGSTTSLSVAGNNESTAITSHEWFVTPESASRKDDLQNLAVKLNTANALTLSTLEGAASLSADHINSLSTGFGILGQAASMAGTAYLLKKGIDESKNFREESQNKATSYLGMEDGGVAAYTGLKVEDASWLYLTSDKKKYASLMSMENGITVGKYSKTEGVVIQSTEDNEIILSKDQATIAIGKKARLNVQKDCISIKFGSNLLQVNNKGIHITGDLTVNGNVNIAKNLVSGGKVKSTAIVEAGASAKSVSKSKHNNKQATGKVLDRMEFNLLEKKSKGEHVSVAAPEAEAETGNNKKRKR